MPQVHTYIRMDDMDKWKALSNKSAFIHNALNGQIFADKEYTVTETKPIKALMEAPDASPKYLKSFGANEVIKTPKDAEKVIGTKLDKLVDEGNKQLAKLCKIHGTPLDSRGKCLQKGCKYA